MGSKSRIVNSILPIIQQKIEDYNIKTYIEPFCGGCNVIDKIKCENKYAFDKQHYLIEFLKNVDKVKDLPNEISREHYSDVRDSYNKKDERYEDWYIGAIGFLSSYNGRFFDGGYAQTNYSESKATGRIIVRNYYKEAKENIIEQLPRLKDIKLSNKSYNEIPLDIYNCLIYCDPPYKDTKQYGVSKSFDYDEFWEWCRKMSKNNIVLISEHNAPDDFKCIWQQEVKRTIDNNKRVKAVEKLFTYNLY